MISNLKRLQNTFFEMKKSDFDISSPLKWGFYFFDKNKDNLLFLSEILEPLDFKKEDIENINNEEWKLHMSKVEVMTPNKLHETNIYLNELAKKYKVDLYDGWDVENI